MPGKSRNLKLLRITSWLFGLVGSCFALQAHAYNNQCLDYLPNTLTSNNNVHVCTSTFNGIESQYVCRDYASGNATYRVLYKGGLMPKAILKLDEQKNQTLVWSRLFGDKEITCPLSPPEGISRHATHRGIGVCKNEHNEAIPCSVYEHAEPRSPEAYRYMVLYDKHGKAPAKITKFLAGKNLAAVEAEFSFQIGMSLLETDCCQEEGIAYIKHAYDLFPHAYTYRVTYHRMKAQLAEK